MSLITKGRHVIGALLITAAAGANAANNPINQNYVELSAADWEAVCSSGTTAGGCFGDVGGQAYKKLERLLGHPATQAGLYTASVPASLFVQQYGPEGIPTGLSTISGAQMATTAAYSCAGYTAGGDSIGTGLVTPAGEGGINFAVETIRRQSVLTSGGQAAWHLTLCAKSSGGSQPCPVPVYVLCLGLGNPATTTPHTLQGLRLS